MSGSYAHRLAAAVAGLGCAVLIGGLVQLPEYTDASWTDNVYGYGEFNVSTFNMQGKVASDGWSEYKNPSSAGVFSWSLSISPGTYNYAPIDLRLDTGSPLTATVDLASPTQGTVSSPPSTQLWNELIYHAYLPSSQNTVCNGTTSIATVLAAKDSPMSTDPTTTWVLAAPTETTPGATTRVCIGLGLKASAPSTIHNLEETVLWTMNAESN